MNPWLAKDCRGWLGIHNLFCLGAYYFDRSIAWLTKQLAISFDPHLLAYFRQGGAEQLRTCLRRSNKAADHETNHGNVDKSFRGRVKTFIVFVKPTILS